MRVAKGVLVEELGQNQGKWHEEGNIMKRGGKRDHKQATDNYGGDYFIHKDAKDCLATIRDHSVLRMNGVIGVKMMTSKMEL